MKKIAFCDFDGTLSKGFISMDFLDYAHGRKLYLQQSYDEQMKIFSQMKKKEMSYGAWCKRWGEVWAEGLEGQHESLISRHAREFFQQFRKNIYPSSYPLVKELKKSGYIVIAVSLGSYDVVSLAAEELGMDECYATRLEFKDGICTGKLATGIHMPGGKEIALKAIAKEKDVPFSSCIAIGDSASDMEMLSLAGVAIALNPTPDLLKAAKQKGIPFFTHENVLEGIKNFLL